MGVITVIKTIKQIHPKDMILVKIGDFYHVYGKDAYILSYLMEYKISKIEENCMTCGFPQKSLSKIQATLENKKINYLLVDRRNKFDVDEKSDNKNLNNYEEHFRKAYKFEKNRKYLYSFDKVNLIFKRYLKFKKMSKNAMKSLKK